MDVKSVFLNGTLEEKVWFEVPNEEEKVYKLKKALYGPKQALRAWYNEINSYFNQCGLKKSPSEAKFYRKPRTGLDIYAYIVYICG